MWNTFKYTVFALLREKSILIWALLFPIILATLFNAMFSGLEKALTLKPISTVVVADANYKNANAFSLVIDSLGASSDSQMLNVTYANTEQDAQVLLQDGTTTSYIVVNGEGVPALYLSQIANGQTLESVNRTILKDILDNYLRSEATITTIAQKNPAALADPNFINEFFSGASYTQQISITANASAQSVRYFYALLGFTALMTAIIALSAITRTQPNLSPLGARRAMGAVSRTKTLVATLTASWLLAFACLLIGFVYIRFILGINFGGKDLACIAGLGISSLLATALGTLIGTIPKLPEGAKGGMLTGITCLLSLFGGLYGSLSLALADNLTRTVPVLQAMNPVKQVADLFYSLYFYDSYDPFFQVIGTLLIITVVLAIVASLFMRRQRYASL
jgi:ABC-2 type transport system permease protein